MDSMMDTTKFKSAFQTTYITEGAVGGYLGAFLLAKYYEYDTVDLMGSYMLESALAGGVSNYLWLLIMSTNVDTITMWKGVLVGAVGQLIWNKWIKSYVSGGV